ncbi:NAD(P)H-binding protein [Bacillus sp. ISL-34]|uniref:SDR family oxidoreductase n=1 Tax=Bacillus sp. ISL-34 TaxID=2819121 RepID=UPI001BE7A02E|nr:NAD(P)H-binding protein [Bacillus sp. ISL-34]MBT2647882.1 NAD(P)H-binding protein [Bacillus sp. ISL-34]
MILVTGATGTVGRYVVERLVGEGRSVRALSRSPEKAKLPNGVEVVSGDLEKTDTFPAFLDGIKKVFWVITHEADKTFPFVARQAGVEQIVLLSSLSINEHPDNAIARFHSAAEEAVRESGVNWTFLRAGGFMSNTLQWAQSIRSEGIVRAPFGTSGAAYIDPRDIADVAVLSLISSGHAEKIYLLTGSELMSPIDQVEVLSDVLQKDIQFIDISEGTALENMKDFYPDEIVEAAIQGLKQANPTGVSPTVKEITGRYPRSFNQWVTDHLNAYR